MWYCAVLVVVCEVSIERKAAVAAWEQRRDNDKAMIVLDRILFIVLDGF